MGLFKKRRSKHRVPAPESMSRDSKDEEIKRLEAERARITADIEKILSACAKETGDRELVRRRYRLGKSPNDYGYKK